MSYDPARVCIDLSTVLYLMTNAHIPQTRPNHAHGSCLSLSLFARTSAHKHHGAERTTSLGCLVVKQVVRQKTKHIHPTAVCAPRWRNFGEGETQECKMSHEISQLSSLWKRMSIISLEYKTQTTSRHAHTIKRHAITRHAPHPLVSRIEPTSRSDASARHPFEQPLDRLVGRPAERDRRRVHEHARVRAAEEARRAGLSEDGRARGQHALVGVRVRIRVGVGVRA